MILSASLACSLLSALVAPLAACSQQSEPTQAAELSGEHHWGQWRGPLGTGAAPHADPPIEWSEEQNVRWKVEVPGLGHSTPVIWDQRIFLTTAIPYGKLLDPVPETAPGAHDNAPITARQEYAALALNRADGKVLWKTTLAKALPHERAHVSGSFASNSPVTDGVHLYAFFGSAGLFCLDMDGVLMWSKDFGKMQSKHSHGEGASPVLHGETLVINWDHEGQSFIVALDKTSGEERWRVEREEVTSWASPIIVMHADRAQVLVSGSQRMRSYDLETGKVIWECGGLSRNVVATPVYADGVVYAGSSYEKQAMIAITLAGATGDVGAKPQLRWMRRKSTPYVPSPLLYGDYLYSLHHYQPTLSRILLATGENASRAHRLRGLGNIYSSPVAAQQRVYISDLDGGTMVLSHGEQPQMLALNHLEDSFSASAALVGRELYLRGRRFLYCIAE